MKKNTMMRLASALLVLVMLTTCAISGTFAKYVTEAAKAEETARVAKWGVTINVSGDTAFSKTYKDAASTVTDEITVESSTEDKLVAPGTNGTLYTLNVEGKPEVDTQITIEADLKLTGWTVDGAEYCPIVFTVGGTEIKFVDTVANLEAAVEEAITKLSKKYEANTDLTTILDNSITWAWDFDDNGKGTNDVKDTALGDAAAAGNAATIALSASIKIVQVD